MATFLCASNFLVCAGDRHCLKPVVIERELSISGLGAWSCLGRGMGAHIEGVRAGRSGLRKLASMPGWTGAFGQLRAGWLSERELLTSRKWSPYAMAALEVAGQALEDAGWNDSQRAAAGLVVASSRGAAAGWLEPWPQRRPFGIMAASNSIHAEAATAISIAHGICGPGHVVASGCAAGLDALGLARLLVRAGEVERVLVVASELPLVGKLLEAYRASGLLAETPQGPGMVPAEGAAAIALEYGPGQSESQKVQFKWFANNRDGLSVASIPQDGGAMVNLLERAVERCGLPDLIIPHATGTAVQERAERGLVSQMPQLGQARWFALKPLIGHTIGASGLLEAAIAAAFLQQGEMAALGSKNQATVFKLASGLGGNHAVAILEAR